MFSLQLRQELQRDVREMLIEPGTVATEPTEHTTDAENNPAAQDMAITAEDIAEIITFAL